MHKYTKLERIGKGSFGCAYLAEKKGDYVNKYVIKEIQVDPRDQKAAIREARLLGALDHPNIIASKESFLLPGNRVLCIVTEYADGGDLRKKLKLCMERGHRMPEDMILNYFVQICLALKHVHDRKILHRDIKPENIFLMKSNVVKLGDFGVAKVLSNTLACADTQTGTPYYTSPEICLGKRYNHKTDIWSLGVVLYEMATLTHAFNGQNQRQLFENIANGVYNATLLSHVSPRLSSLIQEMLLRNPRERPSVNAILKKPIIRDRIQLFLSEKEMLDELNHTVLHGQHILRKRPMLPTSPRAIKQPPPPPLPLVKVRPIVNNRQQNQGVRGYAAPTAAVKQRQELMAQKKERVQALIQKQRAAAEAKLVQERNLRQARAKKLEEKKNDQENNKKVPKHNMAKAVAAFNIQWEQQKQDLLANLPIPPPRSAPAKVNCPNDFKNKLECKEKKQEAKDVLTKDDEFVPPVRSDEVIIAQKYKYPEAKALNDRDLLRKKMSEDIREKKKLMRGKNALEDPVILVQALKPSSDEIPPLPTNSPKVEVMLAPDTIHYESPTHSIEIPMEPPKRDDSKQLHKPQLKVVVEDNSELDFQVQELEPSQLLQTKNIEYERMVLQMQSVMDDTTEETCDDDDEDDKDDVLPAFDTPALDTISKQVLEDPVFKKALRQLLGTNESCEGISSTSLDTLLYMRAYIKDVTASQ